MTNFHAIDEITHRAQKQPVYYFQHVFKIGSFRRVNAKTLYLTGFVLWTRTKISFESVFIMQNRLGKGKGQGCQEEIIFLACCMTYGSSVTLYIQSVLAMVQQDCNIHPFAMFTHTYIHVAIELCGHTSIIRQERVEKSDSLINNQQLVHKNLFNWTKFRPVYVPSDVFVAYNKISQLIQVFFCIVA